MRTLVPLLVSLVATFHAHAQVTITPLVPTSADMVLVHVVLGSCQVRTQSHSVSGNSVTVTIFNDGPNFEPNPPCIDIEPVGPLTSGPYTFVVFVRPASDPVATIPVIVTPASNAADAIEYYYPRLNHYFLTASAVEIAALDAGHFPGWMRTGQTLPSVFLTDPSTGGVQAPVTPVCRFYGLPSAGLDTHFFSASPAECAAVEAKWPTIWLLETPSAFYLYLPNAADGSCPAGTVSVYRLYNNRADVNHRYTTSTDIRAQMISAGWLPEGYGANAVAMCAP